MCRIERRLLAAVALLVLFGAAPVFAQAPAVPSDAAQKTLAKARALMAAGRHAEALAVADLAVELAPAWSEALVLRAEVREREAGAAAATDALAAPRAGVDYGRLATLLGGAADDLEKVLQVEPERTDLEALATRIGDLRARVDLAKKAAAAPPPAPAPPPPIAPPPAQPMAVQPMAVQPMAVQPMALQPMAVQPMIGQAAAVPVSAPSAATSSGPVVRSTHSLALTLQPGFCATGCSGTIFGIGLEVSGEYFGLGLRFMTAGGVNAFAPDLRLQVPVSITNRLILLPHLEAGVLLSGKGVVATFRPGLRVRWDLSERFSLFLSPVIIDLLPFSSSRSFSFALGYELAFGVLLWW